MNEEKAVTGDSNMVWIIAVAIFCGLICSFIPWNDIGDTNFRGVGIPVPSVVWVKHSVSRHYYDYSNSYAFILNPIFFVVMVVIAQIAIRVAKKNRFNKIILFTIVGIYGVVFYISTSYLSILDNGSSGRSLLFVKWMRANALYIATPEKPGIPLLALQVRSDTCAADATASGLKCVKHNVPIIIEKGYIIREGGSLQLSESYIQAALKFPNHLSYYGSKTEDPLYARPAYVAYCIECDSAMKATLLSQD